MSLIIRCNHHYNDEILLFQMGACLSCNKEYEGDELYCSTGCGGGQGSQALC